MSAPELTYATYSGDAYRGKLGGDAFADALPLARARLVAITGEDVPDRCSGAWLMALCAMTDAAQQAATSTTTFEGSMGQLQASVVGLLTGGLDVVKPGITGFVNFLAGAIDGIRAAFSGASGATTPFVAVLSGIVQAFMHSDTRHRDRRRRRPLQAHPRDR